MTKEEAKRTYHAEVRLPANLRLNLETSKQNEPTPEPEAPKELPRQAFSNDLIARLAERIKKL